MMVALTLALFASTSVGSPANPPAVMRSNDDPPIQVWLNSNNNFVRGEGARVYIRAAKDGYVVVLRADAQGRVRVLFPLDPSNDELVRGDRKFEVVGNGGQEAFTVDEGDGTGVVLAAWSESPFTFDGFVQGDQWDDHALEAQSGDNREAALIAIVQGMAGQNHFDYDVANYTVRSVTAYNDGSQNDSSQNDSSQTERPQNDRPSNEGSHNEGPYYGGPYYGPWFGPAYGGFGVSIGFGHRWRYGYAGFGGFCDGFYWSTWGCGPFYDPFFPPLVYLSYGYRPYGYRSYGTVRFGGFRGGSLIGPNRGPYVLRNGAQPRLRTPAGGSLLSGTNRSLPRQRTGTRGVAPGLRSVAPGLRSVAPGSRAYRDGGYARPQTGARTSVAPRGQRARGSAPAARYAPSGGSSRGGWGSAAPRSSGSGYSRGGGGGRRGGGSGVRGGGGGWGWGQTTLRRHGDNTVGRSV